ncbi:hypothetical protein Tco_0069780, partial [Tanacetum coccineum]
MANPNSPNLSEEENGDILEEHVDILKPNEVENPYLDVEDYDGDEEEPEEEPEPNAGHGNQFAQNPNPQPNNMNGWLPADDVVNEVIGNDGVNEDMEGENMGNKDEDMDDDDDAELIFPYEVVGNQTLPPPVESSNSEPLDTESSDVESSDSESSDSESENEEENIAPQAPAGTATLRPLVVRDFPRAFQAGESSSAHDHVGGLEPWALRRDLETTRARARLIEAEVGTNHTETALLDSKIKIGEKERNILNHDLGNVEKTLSNVVERLMILECREIATLKKKLEDKEMQLVIARMDRASVERR